MSIRRANSLLLEPVAQSPTSTATSIVKVQSRFVVIHRGNTPFTVLRALHSSNMAPRMPKLIGNCERKSDCNTPYPDKRQYLTSTTLSGRYGSTPTSLLH